MKRHKNQSRSRSPKNSKNRKDREDRERSKQRSRYRDKRKDSPKNRKSRHSQSSSSFSSSSSSSRSNSRSKRSRQSRDSSNNKKQSKRVRQEQGFPPEFRYKIEETKTLKIENCTDKQAVERALIDASISAGTSVPDQVQAKEGSIYAKYPSVEVSSVIKDLLKQNIVINGASYRINFYPFKRIDLNLSYDWYCDKCDYKNFARRNKCYRCQNQKNDNCKLNYNTAGPTVTKVSKQENINNCSLMVRGPVIIDTEEEVLLDIFEAICPVKDIRMIRNKMTGVLKDFAFIQFFTPEDAALALKQASVSEFKVKGEKISVMYSRNKYEDDYIKPLPYEKQDRKRDFGKKDKKDEPVESYYNRQRQLEIEQEKLRPIITLQQLKQKHQQELKKKANSGRELTQEQAKRRQAEQLARQWEKQAKLQNSVMYICVCCRRKFKGEVEMKQHQQKSDLHKFNKRKLQLTI